MKQALLEQALELSPKEKLELLDALWESLTAEQIPLTEAEKRLLDERLEEQGGYTWEEVKQRHKGQT